MELIELLKDTGINMNLDALQGAGVGAAVGIMAALKKFLKSRGIALKAAVKPWVFLAISAAIAVGVLKARGELGLSEAMALTGLNWMIGMGWHGTQKVVRKGGDDPRRK